MMSTTTGTCACPDELLAETSADEHGYTLACSGCGRTHRVPHFPDEAPLPAPRKVADTAVGRRRRA